MERLREGDGRRPHKFPQGAPSDALAWRCGACGQIVNEMQPDTPCSINWRGVPPLLAEAADEIERLRAELTRLRGELEGAERDSYDLGWADGYTAARDDADGQP